MAPWTICFFYFVLAVTFCTIVYLIGAAPYILEVILIRRGLLRYCTDDAPYIPIHLIDITQLLPQTTNTNQGSTWKAKDMGTNQSQPDKKNLLLKYAVRLDFLATLTHRA